jgi:hypothetical protein
MRKPLPSPPRGKGFLLSPDAVDLGPQLFHRPSQLGDHLVDGIATADAAAITSGLRGPLQWNLPP